MRKIVGKPAMNGGFSDMFIGGLGNDSLYADATTADIFNFDDVSGIDTVFGFVSGLHDLEVEVGVFGGTVDPFDFVTGSNPVAPGATQAILYDTDDGRLFFDADGFGFAAPVHFVTLSGRPTLVASDILLFEV